eukprot:3584561-Rhodomonas_salina.1
MSGTEIAGAVRVMCDTLDGESRIYMMPYAMDEEEEKGEGEGEGGRKEEGEREGEGRKEEGEREDMGERGERGRERKGRELTMWQLSYPVPAPEEREGAPDLDLSPGLTPLHFARYSAKSNANSHEISQRRCVMELRVRTVDNR